ncbi:MAG: hypothetical protein ACTHK7_19100 [Aureliella sp.]
MCYMLYLGAETALPTIAVDWASVDVKADDWPARAPRLEISPLAERDDAVRKHFADAFVVRAGSYERCGCGFNYWPDTLPYTSDADDIATSLAVASDSRAALAEYVATHRVKTLYGCWDGDQALPAEAETTITSEQLRDPSFLLPARTRMLFSS